MKRIVTGLALLTVLMLFLFLSKINQLFFDFLIFVAAYVTLFEMYRSTRKGGFKTMAGPLIVMAIISYPLCAAFGLDGLLIGVVACFILDFTVYIFDSRYTLKDMIMTAFLLIYPFLFIGLAYTLNKDFGMIPLLIALGASFGTDTMAYFVGSTIKGPKIFPKISPKKTYSGCIGGIFGGIIGSLLIYLIFEVWGFPIRTVFTVTNSFSNPILVYSLLGAALSFFAEVGDLGASRIKRELGIKDYGKILGAHGGMMDRLDSILFATVFMTIFMFFAA